MEQQSINQRLNILVDKFEGGKKAAFARKVGISSQGAQELLAGRKGAPSFKVLSQILEQYPSVNANWLVMGQDQMLRDAVALSSPAPLVIEMAQLIQEYMQVSKQLEGTKATYREAASDLAKLRAEVQNHEAIIQLQTEHLPNFGQEGKEMLQNVIQQQQQDLKHARERYAAFLPIQERAEEELISALNHQGKLEKKLGEFISSAVPLTAEAQMEAINARLQLSQAFDTASNAK